MLMKSRVAALVILFAAATGAHQPMAASNVPNPTVIGPIPAAVAPGDPSHRTVSNGPDSRARGGAHNPASLTRYFVVIAIHRCSIARLAVARRAASATS